MAALASDAELFLLDEPTAELDPLMEIVFQDVVQQLRTEGRTVFLSSHILAQVEKLADVISVIRLGRVVQSGTQPEMRHLTRTTIEAHTAIPVTGLDRLAAVHNVDVGDGRVRFAVDGQHLDAAVRHVSGFGIFALTSHPLTLEELMLRHYGDEIAANAGGQPPGRGGRRSSVPSRRCSVRGPIACSYLYVFARWPRAAGPEVWLLRRKSAADTEHDALCVMATLPQRTGSLDSAGSTPLTVRW